MFNEWTDIEGQLIAGGFDPAKVREELISGKELALNMAGIKQRQIAGETAQQDFCPVDGIGECVARIDLDAYFYWAMREKGCWSDKKFLKEFLRDNPEVRVQSKPRETTIIRP